MRIVPGFIVREIVGEIVAIPTGSSAHTLSGLVSLNGAGRFLFDLLQTDRTEAELIEELCAEYDVSKDTASTDVADFLLILRQNHLLLETP